MRTRTMLACGVFAGLLAAGLSPLPASASGGGELDPTFGAGGKVLTDFGGQEVGYGMAVQTDGKVVVAGYTNLDGKYDFALARYNDDGSLDATFGTGGTVLTDVGGLDVARAVAIQADGKIVLAGGSSGDQGTDFALARYDRDGSLDVTFGSGGKVLTDVSGTGRYDTAYAVAIRADGTIVAAGTADSANNSGEFALARYRRDGALDAAFGADGTALTDLGGNDVAYAQAVLANGKVVVAGSAAAAGGTDDFALARYNDDGSLDTGFGTGGRVLTDVAGAGRADRVQGLAIQPDGKIVAAGAANTGVGYDFALARYGEDGALDSGFGADGTVLTALSAQDSYDVAVAVASQPGGRIVVAGVAGSARSSDFALVRYDPNGGLDPTFGTGGTVLTDFSGGSSDVAFAVAVLPGGKILTAGYSGRPLIPDFALARYLP